MIAVFIKELQSRTECSLQGVEREQIWNSQDPEFPSWYILMLRIRFWQLPVPALVAYSSRLYIRYILQHQYWLKCAHTFIWQSLACSMFSLPKPLFNFLGIFQIVFNFTIKQKHLTTFTSLKAQHGFLVYWKSSPSGSICLFCFFSLDIS